MSVEFSQKETKYIEAVRGNLQKGRLLAIVWIAIMCLQLAVIYFGLQMLKQMDTSAKEMQGQRLEVVSPSTYIGIAIGACVASLIWTFVQAVKFAVGGRMEKLLVKCYAALQPAGDNNPSSQISPELSAAIASEKAAMENEKTAGDKPDTADLSSN